jgi:hypothetical protein
MKFGLNLKEIKLVKQFLEFLSVELSRKSCNDFDFPSNWSEDDVRVFIRQYHQWNENKVSPEDYDPEDLHLPDYCVVSILAEKIDNFYSAISDMKCRHCGRNSN